MSLYSLVIYVPVTHAQVIRNALAVSGAGSIGNYDSCSFSSRGQGRFRPLQGANPTIGQVGDVEVVDEERIECEVLEPRLTGVIEAVVAAHPYEQPAMQIHPILDYSSFIKHSADPIPSASTSLSSSTFSAIPQKKKGISVVLEGLDGIGKTTTLQALARRLDAKQMRTPPEQMQSYRSWFVNQPDPAMRKAFYMVGNFMAGDLMREAVQRGEHVVLDRYYASTMAYILGKADLDKPLPPPNDAIYSWPEELYKPDFTVVLMMKEADRVARRGQRTSVAATEEDKLLEQNPHIPERINEVYLRYGCTKLEILADDSTTDIVDKIMKLLQIDV